MTAQTAGAPLIFRKDLGATLELAPPCKNSATTR